MSLRRQVSWSSALRDMRGDRGSADARRAAIAASMALKLAASKAKDEAREAVRIADAAPLFAEGRFDRSAIMSRAWARARAARAHGDARPWRKLVSLELRRAWAWARDARRAAAH